MRVKLLVVAASVAIVVAAGWGMRGLATPVPGAERARHTPFHIGCKHHNHGPKWHAGHGRTLQGSRWARDEGSADDGLAARAITSGRP